MDDPVPVQGRFRFVAGEPGSRDDLDRSLLSLSLPGRPVDGSLVLPEVPPGFFFVLGAKFQSFEKWPETTEIRKEDFENAFNNKVDIQNTYIEVYSNDAGYYMCHIYLGPIIVWYYIMTVRKQIILIFYRFVKT